MILILPFLFAIVIAGNNQAISAIDSNCPYITGTLLIIVGQIYIYNQSSSASMSEKITVNFQFIFSYAPRGIVLSPRTHESNSQYLCVDFNLISQDISSTGFVLFIKLSQTISVIYQKIIVNYFTISPTMRYVYMISSYEQYSPHETSADGSTFSWKLNIAPLAINPSGYFLSQHYISKMCMCGLSKNLTLSIPLDKYYSDNKTYTVSYKIMASTGFSMDLSGVLVDIIQFNSTNYYYYFKAFTSNQKFLVYQFNDIISYSTLFLGLRTIKTLILTEQMSFNFGFTNQAEYDNTLLFRQQNPQTFINLTQKNAANFQFIGTIFGFTLQNCSIYPDNLYSWILTSQCLKICSIGSYPSSNKTCFNCFVLSSNSQFHDQCYEKGCLQRYFFDLSSSKPKCTECKNKIENCDKCKYDTNKVLKCQICLQDYLLDATNNQCYLCNEKFPGCVKCEDDGSRCLKPQNYYDDQDDSDDEDQSQPQSSSQTSSPSNPIRTNPTQTNPTPIPDTNTNTNTNTDTTPESDPTSKPNQNPNPNPNPNPTPDQNQGGNGQKDNQTNDPQQQNQSPPQQQQRVDQQQQQPVTTSCNNSSYLEQNNSQCILCSKKISNCKKCHLNNSQLQCQQCSSKYNLYSQAENNTNYIYSTFVDYQSKQCRICGPYCTQCINQLHCLSCYSSDTLNTKLQSNQCIKCNNNITDFLSQWPLCSISTQTICMLAKYNAKTNKCQYNQDVKEAINMFATVTSLNVFHAVFRQLQLIVSLFEDFSYYSFHQRNYSKIMISFFSEMTAFTLARFKPSFLKTVYQMINFNYDNFSLVAGADKFPRQFITYGKTIHFMTATQDIWLGTLPTHIVMLITLLLAKWLIGMFKKGFCSQYNIPGFILVLLLESNFQYLCFRAFSQLHELTPFNTIYILNLIQAYAVLFILIIYAAGGSLLYKSVYKQIFSSQYFEITDQRNWIAYWISNNLLKMSSAFVHTFFYYYPMTQCCLLLCILIFRILLGMKFMRNIKTTLEYVLQLQISTLFMILQLFFLAQMLLTIRHQYTVYIEIYTGNIEYTLAIMMVFSEVLSVVFKIAYTILKLVVSKIQSIIQNKKQQSESSNQIQQVISSQINYKVTPSNGSTNDSLEEVNLDDDIPIAIPLRYQKTVKHRNGMNDFTNINQSKIEDILSKRYSCQPEKVRQIKTSKFVYPKTDDTDYQSVIQMITNKIKQKTLQKNKMKNQSIFQKNLL